MRPQRPHRACGPVHVHRTRWRCAIITPSSPTTLGKTPKCRSWSLGQRRFRPSVAPAPSPPAPRLRPAFGRAKVWRIPPAGVLFVPAVVRCQARAESVRVCTPDTFRIVCESPPSRRRRSIFSIGVRQRLAPRTVEERCRFHELLSQHRSITGCLSKRTAAASSGRFDLPE